jgi:hypothetical protein
MCDGTSGQLGQESAKGGVFIQQQLLREPEDGNV